LTVTRRGAHTEQVPGKKKRVRLAKPALIDPKSYNIAR